MGHDNKETKKRRTSAVKTLSDTESPTQPDRRKTLLKIALGGGLVSGFTAIPKRWAKPLVDKVLVPAHAATSPTLPQTLFRVNLVTGYSDQQSNYESFVFFLHPNVFPSGNTENTLSLDQGHAQCSSDPRLSDILILTSSTQPPAIEAPHDVYYPHCKSFKTGNYLLTIKAFIDGNDLVITLESVTTL